jgi:integrase
MEISKIKQLLLHSKDESLIKARSHLFNNIEELEQYCDEFLTLSYDNMRFRRTIDLFLFEHKYRVHKPRKLGNQNRIIDGEELKPTLEDIKKNFGDKFYLASKFESIEGSRGQDTVRLKLDDLDFEHHEVSITNRKIGGHIYKLPLNRELEDEIHDFIENNLCEIKKHNNYIFFNSDPRRKGVNHISQSYLRTIFRNTLKKLNLYHVYAKSSDGRDLGLECLHSLRGHAANRIYEKSGHNAEKVKEFLDHTDLKSYKYYIKTPKPNEDLKELI